MTVEEGLVTSTFVPSSNKYSTLNYSQTRTGFGGGLIYMPDGKGFGADIKLLYNSYSDAKALKGQSSGMIQFGLIYGFNSF